MAKPRIFISSTYYDLKHIRSSLDVFIDNLGFEPVLSEKGDIAYTHDRPLDESCYREAENSDLFVLIVGGRYGSESSNSNKKKETGFFNRYESITKKEFDSAITRDIPVYILIEKGVYAEFQTFLRNKEKADLNYAHVDSVNIFLFIEEILAKPRNNPIQTFEKFEEISDWLKEQWAGLFREFLRKQFQHKQISSLSLQVGELKEINETLKTYLEALMTGLHKDQIPKLIENEERRLDELRKHELLRNNRWVRHVSEYCKLDFAVVIRAITECKDFAGFFDRLRKSGGNIEEIGHAESLLLTNGQAMADFNEAREIIDLAPVEFPIILDPSENRFINESIIKKRPRLPRRTPLKRNNQSGNSNPNT